MHKQTVRLIVFSSMAIIFMTLAWGVNQIPRQKRMAEQTLKASVEQELLVLSSAVKASTQALRYRLLDVMKGESADKPGARAFQDSPFASVTLLEWDSMQWKSVWHTTKFKDRLQIEDLRSWMRDWPLAKIAPTEAYFVRVGDVGGVAHFAMVVPVRKNSGSSMLGVGVFAASEFGLSFSADRTRDVKVVDDRGFALSLSRPAYLGVSLRKENLISEMVDGEEVSTRKEWDANGGTSFGVATRMADSNLIASIETPVNFGSGYLWQGWMYLILCAAGAALLNWWLFNTMLGPLLKQISQADSAIEALKRSISMNEGASSGLRVAAVDAAGLVAAAKGELEDFSFLDAQTPAAAVEPEAIRVSLGKIVSAALRAQESRIKELGIRVQTAGIENVMVTTDSLQLQTALEEVIKNSIESMEEGEPRVLTILGEMRAGRVHLTIEDTGCGVEAANLDKVFDPFFSTKDAQGVSRGLGLNVVRRVIEEFKGSVELKSNGSGTTVELEWPDEDMILTAQDEFEEDFEEDFEPGVHAGALSKEPLELAEDDDFETMIMSAPLVPSSKREFPQVEIRKPKVRDLN